jgi:large subunit ribosomal protein L20
MTRITRGTVANKRRRNVLKAAKGYRYHRSKTERGAKVALRKAGVHAFSHRKDKKNDMRKLWNVKINASLRELGTTYNVFIHKLKTANIALDRKVLAEMAEKHPKAFANLVSQVK